MAVDIKDKVAVVTGASRGIGRAAALALAKERYHVVITARSKDELDTLAAVVFAAKQPPKSRILVIGMRPKSETT